MRIENDDKLHGNLFSVRFWEDSYREKSLDFTIECVLSKLSFSNIVDNVLHYQIVENNQIITAKCALQ